MINQPTYQTPQEMQNTYPVYEPPVEVSSSGGSSKGCLIGILVAIFIIISIAGAVLAYSLIKPDHFTKIKDCILNEDECGGATGIVEPTDEPTPTVTPTEILLDYIDTDEWLTFKNSEIKFTFMYPEEYLVDREDVTADETYLYLIKEDRSKIFSIEIIKDEENNIENVTSSRIAHQNGGDISYKDIETKSVTFKMATDPILNLEAYGYEYEPGLYVVIKNENADGEFVDAFLNTFEFETNTLD